MDRSGDGPDGGGGEVASMDDLERRLVSWASRRPDIRTVLVVGSRARTDPPGDEWSDLDIVFTTTSRARYVSTTDWLPEISEVWATYSDPFDGITRHVLFAGALDAGITPVSNTRLRGLFLVRKLRTRLPMLFRLLPRVVRDAIDRRVVSAKVQEETAGATGAIFGHSRRTARVILDKDGLGAKVLAMLPDGLESADPPTTEEFGAVVEEFLFLSVWNAKHLRRGELWWAKTVACDGQMKSLLLRMIEWHARATNGADDNTWRKGRHFESWVDPRLLERVRATFGHYDEDDVWRASLETMRLFRTVAIETAECLGFPYPTGIDARVADWVTRCEAERHEMGP